MTNRKRLCSGLMTAAVVAWGALASAKEDALAFLRNEHQAIVALLRQPRSASRDSQIDARLTGLIDPDELARRSFGQPCPPARPSCTNHWATLTPAQQAEVKPLLEKVIVLSERKNVLKTLDYDVDYTGERAAEGATKVRMEAKNRLKPRDPPLQIDYLIALARDRWRVVDIVTEGSSRTRNFYDQFHRMLSDPAQGYPYVVAKLKENIAKKEAAARETR
jgi:hypothetical protein